MVYRNSHCSAVRRPTGFALLAGRTGRRQTSGWFQTAHGNDYLPGCDVALHPDDSEGYGFALRRVFPRRSPDCNYSNSRWQGGNNLGQIAFTKRRERNLKGERNAVPSLSGTHPYRLGLLL